MVILFQVNSTMGDARSISICHGHKEQPMIIPLILLINIATSMQPSTTWKPITFSVYSPELHNKPVAYRGMMYDRNKFTCASNTHKLGTHIYIRSKYGSCWVRVTDRMATRFTGRRIDLSSAAMKVLCPSYNTRNSTTMRKTEGLVKGWYTSSQSGVNNYLTKNSWKKANPSPKERNKHQTQ